MVVMGLLQHLVVGLDLRELMVTAVAFTGIALTAQGIKLAVAYVGEIVAWRTTNELRADLALHCLKLDMSFHKTHKPGELIERVDGDHLRHHVHLDGQLAGFFFKHVAGDEIAERVLLPVDEMIGRSDIQRIVVQRCPGMGRRTQSNLVRCQGYQSIEQVIGFVVDGDAYGHGFDRLNCNS